MCIFQISLLNITKFNIVGHVIGSIVPHVIIKLLYLNNTSGTNVITYIFEIIIQILCD